MSLLKKCAGAAKGNPLIAIALIFLAIAYPINHYLLKDYPGNPIEVIEVFIVKTVFGLDVDPEDL